MPWHRLGFHEVYDTTYGADLTVIEEAEELLERISSGAKGPLFTSAARLGQVLRDPVSGAGGQYFHLPLSPADVRRGDPGILPQS